ncbi:tandem-95 repeat protein [uncultured Tateyamaria sp.]|uniref:tandem-95 repeat protein n=1 Tax=uncultured Tateyamaria sp. TaxID=455651 RepID=UPI0026326DF3|nr:tandem-95 repeat protein [uncultured Tateyamaria sp.]
MTVMNTPPAAGHDFVGVSEFLVNEFTNNSQISSSVTALANGHFVVTWQSDDRQQGDTSNSAIKARIFDADGVEIVSEFLVNEFANGRQGSPSVTALANSHFVVTWQSEDGQQGDTSQTAVKARIFDADGNEIVSEFLVNEFANGRQDFPSITALDNGHFVVTWQSYDRQQGDASGGAVKACIFDADGNEIVSEFLVNEFANGRQGSPSITALYNGHFVVTWESDGQQQGDTSSIVIKARVFDANGNETASEFLVNEFTNSRQTDPSVTALANGHFVVAWTSADQQQGDTSGWAIKARILDADGNEIVSEFLVNEFTNGTQSSPSVTALTNGNFIVTWQSWDQQQGDTSLGAIKARIFDASGNEIVSEFLVNEFPNGGQYGSNVTALANGDFVVTWTSGDEQQDDTSSWAIKARIFDANGIAQNPNLVTEDAVTLIDTATLLANDNDVDGDVLTVTDVSTTSTHGATLTLNTDGTISYDPTGAGAVQALAEGQTLTDTFAYTVSDGHGGESTATVSVVVHGTNDAPVVALALPDHSSAEDDAVSFALPVNAFTDVDGDALTLSATLVGGAALPDWLVFDAVAGSFSGTPPQDFNGMVNVLVTASDGSLSASDVFALEITPVNDAPVAADDVAQSPTPVTEDVVTSIDIATLLANDSDIDGDALAVTAVSALSTHGATLTLNTNGTISYDPTGVGAVQALAEGQTLTDTFTYTVSDGHGGESTATVSVVVHGRNEAPIFGTAGDDTLSGNAGDDSLWGLGGDDSLYGGDGNDSLYGGAGDDDLYGDSGNDHIIGGFGSDTIYGRSGADNLNGDKGKDYLIGGAGNDTLNGGMGNDYIEGGAGDDILYAGENNPFEIQEITRGYVDNDPNAVRAGDFDGDGFDDRATFWRDSGWNRFNYGDADGGHTSSSDPINRGAIDNQPHFYAVGDFDGDSRDDLAIAWRDSGWNRLYFGQSDRTFDQVLDPINRGAIDNNPDRMVSGDFNGDGRDDLLFHWSSGGQNRLYLGNSDSTFTQILDPIQKISIDNDSTTGNITSIQTGDYDGDGFDDLAFFFKDTGKLRLVYGNDEVSLSVSESSIERSLLQYSDRVLSGDFNGDGLDDIVFASSSNGNNIVVLGTEDRSQQQIYYNAFSTSALTGSNTIWTTGDFNNDGVDEIMKLDRSSGANSYYNVELADILRGGAGNDQINGGAGDDILNGGTGNDQLRGSSGNDEFVFRDSFGSDTIIDFEDGTDLIRVDIAGISYSDLTITSSGSSGSEVSVSGHGTITLSNIDPTNLTEADFLF